MSILHGDLARCSIDAIEAILWELEDLPGGPRQSDGRATNGRGARTAVASSNKVVGSLHPHDAPADETPPPGKGTPSPPDWGSRFEEFKQTRCPAERTTIDLVVKALRAKSQHLTQKKLFENQGITESAKRLLADAVLADVLTKRERRKGSGYGLPEWEAEATPTE